jgi:glycosyltransferase involved in cell wall biosynthesis
VDAARWLVEDVLPIIRSVRNDVTLSIVGSSPTDDVQALSKHGVEVAGYVSYDELARRYATARVAVIPLRFGAGVKLKVIEAMRFGVPLITTPVGAQGLPGLENVASVHKDAPVIASAVLKLLEDDKEWERQSVAQSAYVRRRFSEGAMRQSVTEAFSTLSGKPV